MAFIHAHAAYPMDVVLCLIFDRKVTNREKELQERYSKAIREGNKMLDRAAELDKLAAGMKAGLNPHDKQYVQAVQYQLMADELRMFYTNMFG